MARKSATRMPTPYDGAMRTAVLVVALGALLFVGVASQAAPQPVPSVVSAAQAWLSLLTPAQRGKANLAWNAPNRRHWGYRPFVRRGLPLREMTSDQRTSLDSMLKRALTAHGHAEVQAILARERILRNNLSPAQRRTDWRDPGLYYLAIFGTPRLDASAAWSWRLGGHHLSLNLTYRGERLVSATPYFVGGSPVQTRDGQHVTRAEEDLGRQLFRSLDPKQVSAATWPRALPGDIDMQRGRPVTAAGAWGISGAALNPVQKVLLQRLVAAFGAGVDTPLLRTDAVDVMRFAWRGQGRNQYYRIVGKDFAIEYLNADNHMHSVWRHPTQDFGGK